jgi:hypothetical protein
LDAENQEIVANFEIVGHDCWEPQLTLKYEQLDHSETYEYLEVSDSFNTSLDMCGGYNAKCGHWKTCFHHQSIDTDLEVNSTYTVSVYAAWQVDYVCGYGMHVNFTL